MTALSGHEPQIKISIPAAASRLLGALRRAGFEAYVVGGCVRDSLLGRTPGDWDICTSARPEQVRTVFSAYRQILTGEKHGTVAVIVGGTSMSGGKGSVVGTVFGMLIIAVMNNLLNLLGVPPFLREAFKGAIIIAAVLLQRKSSDN